MPMRIAVTGKEGQLVCSLLERAPPGVTVVAVGPPDLDLCETIGIAPALRAVRPDLVVNAGAYTAVDEAESEPALVHRINGEAAGVVAATAASLEIPVIQISTDYVFDGGLDRAWREDDPTRPLGVYGASKLAGEQAVAAATADHLILRTAWVYSPFGKNFVRTMLRLAETKSEIAVVGDQIGCPTCALDLADAVFAVARTVVADRSERLRGIFHVAGRGETSWAGFADAIFAEREKAGLPPVRVRPIGTADYPTPARRPANSRLDCSRLAALHGVTLPDWRASLGPVVQRLLASGNAT